MTTSASKLWFGVAALSVVAFFAYGFASAWDWFGTFVLATIGVVTLLLGVLASLLRDGTVAAGEAEGAASFALPAAWPALGAVGAGLGIIGLAGRNNLFWVGVGVLVVVLGEWLIQGWAERATGDPAANKELRNRLMLPVEIPVTAVIVVAGVLISLSRVLLAVSETGSRVVAMVVATAILLVAFVIAYRPRIGSAVVSGVLALGAVALLAAGIAGGVAGERTIEHHEEIHTTTTTTPGSTPADGY